ncbi:uncharacterized protein LOC142771564 isoform X2 [Rhipicephalus microplus]|uniref:uncharacterized protein LOC142771564 isoform X2 n=1 Tax=Rhipicephalus microplus TaxID=6941 RepID=UPI003F6C937C
MKNPKNIQEESRKVTEHFQLITEVRQFGREGILCCSPDQACVSDLLKCTSFAPLPIYSRTLLQRTPLQRNFRYNEKITVPRQQSIGITVPRQQSIGVKRAQPEMPYPPPSTRRSMYRTGIKN